MLKLTLRELFAILTVAAMAAAWWVDHHRLRSEAGGGARWNPAPNHLYRTGRELDLAIVGKGFFQLRDDETGEEFFTRYGRFRLDSTGRIRWGKRAGNLMLEPAVTFAQYSSDVAVSPTGRIHCREAGSDLLTEVGVFQLATFMNPEQLKPMGGDLWAVSDETGPPLIDEPGKSGIGFIQHEWLEESSRWAMLRENAILVVVSCSAAAGVLAWGFSKLARIPTTTD
jgi:hypothetical protein